MASWRSVIPIVPLLTLTINGDSQIVNRLERISPSDPYEEAYSPYRSKNDIYGSWPVTTRAYIPSPQLTSSLQINPSFVDSNLVRRPPLVWNPILPTTIVSVRDEPHKLVGINPPFSSSSVPAPVALPASAPAHAVPHSNPSGDSDKPVLTGNRVSSRSVSRAMDTLTIDGGNLRPAHNHTDVAPPVDKSFLDFIADWEGKNDVDAQLPYNISDPLDDQLELDLRDPTLDNDNHESIGDSTRRSDSDVAPPNSPLTAMKSENPEFYLNEATKEIPTVTDDTNNDAIDISQSHSANDVLSEPIKESASSILSNNESIHNSSEIGHEELLSEPHVAETTEPNELFFTEPVAALPPKKDPDDRTMQYALPCCTPRLSKIT